jgi:hypothetical protein
MANLDDPTPTGGDSDPAALVNVPPLEQRVRRLELENAALKAELADLCRKYAIERDISRALSLEGTPRTKEELEEMIRTSVPFADVLRELEAEYGVGGAK